MWPLFSHTGIITGATGCGKTHFLLNKMLLTEFKDFFKVVIVICPTFIHNKTYKEFYPTKTGYYWVNPNDPRGLSIISPRLPRKKANLQEWIEALSQQFAGCGEMLFIIDDMAADQQIVRKKSALTELAISGRHTQRSLWVVTQKYNAICKDVREQAMFVVSSWCKDLKSWKDMLEENDVGISKDDKVKLYNNIKSTRHACVVLKCFQPVSWVVITS